MAGIDGRGIKVIKKKDIQEKPVDPEPKTEIKKKTPEDWLNESLSEIAKGNQAEREEFYGKRM